jgi:hypothetical protein
VRRSKEVNARTEHGPAAPDNPHGISEVNDMSLLGTLIDVETVVPVLIFGIPIIAIVGGITSAIVKTIMDARIVENAQRERLAAIQAGIDPGRLPPLPAIGSASAAFAAVDPEAASRHRQQGLLIGGIVTTFVGFGLMLFLYFIVDSADPVWAVGILPIFVGIALFLSAWIVKPPKRS